MKIADINGIQANQSAGQFYLMEASNGVTTGKSKATLRVLAVIGFIVLTYWISLATSSADQVIVFIR